MKKLCAILVAVVVIGAPGAGWGEEGNNSKMMPPPEEVIYFLKQSLAKNRKNMNEAAAFIESLPKSPELEFKLEHGFNVYKEYLIMADYFEIILLESLNYYSRVKSSGIDLEENFIKSLYYFFDIIVKSKINYVDKKFRSTHHVYDEYFVQIKNTLDLVDEYITMFEPLISRNKKGAFSGDMKHNELSKDELAVILRLLNTKKMAKDLME